MSILNFLRRRNTTTASVAKERLQIIISHERSERNTPNCLPKIQDFPKMQEEILNVITKYVTVDRDKVSVNLERVGDSAVLELNFAMPENAEAAVE
ncbi:MAG: cell division topological specificity factor MinE [Legionellaceae bacterium]|nr:cell division topological specificity factor MinE [Legionellaceae bacterium]